MKYVFLTALVLLLTMVVVSLGCIGGIPVTDPLAGDPVLGEWLGNKQTTQIDSSTGEILKICRNCMVKIDADGRGTLSHHYYERGSSSFAYSFGGMLPFPNRKMSIRLMALRRGRM